MQRNTIAVNLSRAKLLPTLLVNLATWPEIRIVEPANTGAAGVTSGYMPMALA